MASKGLPLTEMVLILTILIEVGGGLLIAVGWKARWGALAIFIFLIPTTLVFHAFWAVDPSEVQSEMIQFNKNLAIMGGMLYIMVTGSGRYGLDKEVESIHPAVGAPDPDQLLRVLARCRGTHTS